ncbi:hypothetical protein M0R89_01970 [Halorussus limi]|uniref:Antibiotic biosynthesis monooxygenase n=1 Tax=Halorussus limi TaxID=2938695 RepID=A0A8U0HV76_9EURY|nr:hypothetical protein [Halorussus limi]UPV74848.1 hypothetical protein M0R89_01970 [Halorussus limi]
MIERIWHGWTTPENADEYERLLREEIFPGFADRNIEGYRGFRVLRRESDVGGAEDRNGGNREGGRDGETDDAAEVEFVTAMRFDSLDAVREFAGEDYERAHVPDVAREVLSRWDDRARHYEVRERDEF